MGHLDQAGVDVGRILADAHAAGLGTDQTVAAVTTGPPRSLHPRPETARQSLKRGWAPTRGRS
ncbi:hypothetical protein WKI68_42375 [Streptomyces sp. MS1.HAVA.3]|uniref:Uncharacterized protein n=1 Tax=Streptomyces caledonius TaxID=3134107 RepID=A0ABU8UG18_9ACTN